MNRDHSVARFLQKSFHRLVFVCCILVLIAFSICYSNVQFEFIRNDRALWESKGYKTILIHVPSWLGYRDGIETFKELNCPVDKCRLTTNELERGTADMVIFHDKYILQTNRSRSPKQIYALYNTESPFHTSSIPYPDIINWTITYRYDSTIPAPYSKWTYNNPDVKQVDQNINYAANKTKKVAWFVSNCYDKNGRLDYGLELQKYIQVDIYGKCGTFSCPRTKTKECYDILDKEYKFYLAFENSNCKHYITEKLFENALSRNILPIVRGAPIEDYEEYAPERSFIHVDDFESPKELANYLHILDGNDDMYNSFFRWKGTGKISNDHKTFICRVCAKLNEDRATSTASWYKDINKWWRGPGVCTNGSWKRIDAAKWPTIGRTYY